MNSAKVCIFTKIGQEGFSSFLNCKERLTLEANLLIARACDFANDLLEGILWEHQIGTVLISPDLFENDGAWSGSHSFLDLVLFGGLRQDLPHRIVALRTLCITLAEVLLVVSRRRQSLTKVSFLRGLSLVAHQLRSRLLEGHLLLRLCSSLDFRHWQKFLCFLLLPIYNSDCL